MKKILAFVCLLCSLPLFAQDEEIDSTQYFIDQVESSLQYETGVITFDSVGAVTVPAGFRYLNAEQSAYVLTTLWGNPNGDYGRP